MHEAPIAVKKELVSTALECLLHLLTAPATLTGTMQTEVYQVSARKERPKRFSDVVGQMAVVTTLKNAIDSNQVASAYLFCGPRGTGKTTLARLVAMALNCENRLGIEPCSACATCLDIASSRSMDVIEIDGASHRGIDEIRQINETVGYAPSPGKTKVYIIDEVHMLTKEAFNALLKTLEEPPSSVLFVFATTEPEKVPATIISRCQRFFLERIETEKIYATLQSLCDKNSWPHEPRALELIAEAAEGGMRDALSLLDQVRAFDSSLTFASAQKALGKAPKAFLIELDCASKSRNIASAFTLAERLVHSGQSPKAIIEALIDHFRRRLLLLIGNDSEALAKCDPKYADALKSEPSLYSEALCLQWIDTLIDALSRLLHVVSERVLIEVLFLKIIASKSPLALSPKPKSQPIVKGADLQHDIKNVSEPQSKLQAKLQDLTPDQTEKKQVEQSKQSNDSAPALAEAPSAGEFSSAQKAKHDALIRFAAVELDASIENKDV